MNRRAKPQCGLPEYAAYPTKINEADEVLNIPGCGPSVARKVCAFIQDLKTNQTID
jgi:hypothetical protein